MTEFESLEALPPSASDRRGRMYLPSPEPASALAPAADVVALAARRPPTLGDSRLICIDGPAGSGKTTLASEIRAALGCPVVHVDHMLDGWDGLPGVEATLTALLLPVREGRAGSH